MSLDAERGFLYVPTSTPSSDYWGGRRRGANLFAESLVCLDACTGERRWHFQAVHHGVWDYDLFAAPNLVTINVDGREIDAVAQVSKHGFTFVFDRVTGEPVWPIEERPVDTSMATRVRWYRGGTRIPWRWRPVPVRLRQGNRCRNLAWRDAAADQREPDDLPDAVGAAVRGHRDGWRGGRGAGRLRATRVVTG